MDKTITASMVINVEIIHGYFKFQLLNQAIRRCA